MCANTDVLIASTSGKDLKGAITMQKKKSVSEADHNDYRQLNVVNGIHFPYIKPLALYK